MTGTRNAARLWTFPLLLAGLCAGFALLPAAPASASQTPTLSLQPSSGPVDTTFTASASGFTPQELLEFYFNGADTNVGCATDLTGACIVNIFVPPGLTTGPYTVSATGSNGDSARAVFDVTPTLSLSPSSGPVASVFTASPAGFGSGEAVDLTFNGLPVGSCLADPSGDCSASVTVPNLPSGAFSVTARGVASGAVATAAFVVTPGLVLQPALGPAGSAFNASLTGFAPSEQAEISFNGTDDQAGCATNASGSCTLNAFVPQGLPGATYTVEARDSSGNAADAAFTVTQTLSLSPASGAVGSALTASVAGFSAGETVDLSWSGGPVGQCTAAVNGACSTPVTVPGGPTGNATVSATGESSGDVASATFLVTPSIAGCVSPQITSAAAATALVGTPFTFTVTTCTAAVPKITAKGLPKGLHLTDNLNGTATIAGTPAAKQSGLYTATITASVKTRAAPALHRPALTLVTTQQFVVTLDSAPVFTSKAAYVDTTGGAFSYQVTTAYGYPVPTFTESGLPPGATLTDSGNGRAVLAEPGPVNDGGVYHVVLTAGDPAGIPGLVPVTQSFTLTLYQTPSVTSGAGEVISPGVPMTAYTVTDIGYPLPRLTAAGLPAGLKFRDNHDGTATISGTPMPTAPALSNVTITASNRAGSSAQTFGLQIDGKAQGTVAIAPTHDGLGYWIVNNDGDVECRGDAVFLGSLTGLGDSNIVNAVSTPDSHGYWLVSATGGVDAFGDAHFFGSLNGQVADVVDLTPTADGGGYWLSEANGTVTPYGDATAHGSLSGVNDVVGLVSPDAGGYWLVEANGTVNALGDATAHGSASGVNDVVAMAAPDAGGYWLAETNGSVDTFGDAGSFGSLSVNDIVDIAATPDGQGYWEIGTDGFVINFGDAGFYGNG